MEILSPWNVLYAIEISIKQSDKIMTNELTIFKKEYDSESLYDLGRDIHEVFDERFNKIVKQIPLEESGFHQGTFTVSISWKSEE